MVEPLAGNQGLNIGLLADKSSSITATDMGKIQNDAAGAALEGGMMNAVVDGVV